MSALGDYIHFNKSNYLKYGTSRYGESSDPLVNSLNQQKQSNMQKINSINDINPTILNELKQRISKESTQKEAYEMAQDLLNYNKNIVDAEKRIKEQIINNVPKNFQGGNVRLVKKNLKINSSLTNVETAKKYRRRIYDNINVINKNIELGKPVKESSIQSLLDNCSNFFNYLGIENSKLEFLKVKNLNEKNTVNALKSVIQSLSIDEATKATLHGTYGEILVNITSDQIRIKAEKELYDSVKSALSTGATRASFKIDESSLTPKVATVFQEKTGLNLYQVKATQDKVDASVTINNYPIEASVKAYTPKGNVIRPHLQDINLITNLIKTEAQFANHWISLHAYDQMNIEEADETLKKHLEYEALVSGNLLKSGNLVADTFIVIDVSQGRVYTKSTKDILNQGTNFILNPSLNSIFFKNEFASTWEERIANILIQMHQKKISVMYKVQLT